MKNTKQTIKSVKWLRLALLCLPAFLLLNTYSANGGTCHAKYSYTASGLSVSFHDSATASGKITYNWFFGDNTSSTDQNPTHAYAKAGTYYCCEKITDSANSC